MTKLARRLAGVLCVGLFPACAPSGPAREHVEALFALDSKRVPIPPASPAVVALGAELFRRGCQSCHDLASHGQDGKNHQASRTSSQPARNTPTVYDAARQVAHGWDGTVSDLGKLVRRELALRLDLHDDADVVAWARRAVPSANPTTQEEVTRTLLGFLCTLRSVGRWDRYVEGDDSELSPAERAGARTFLDLGCAACHGGRNLGGGSAHKLGATHPYPSSDLGRAGLTQRDEDRFVFRAPMLRRVAHTGPYLHDGSVPTLDAMIRLMAWHELGKEVTDEQVAAVGAFLRAVGDLETPPK